MFLSENVFECKLILWTVAGETTTWCPEEEKANTNCRWWARVKDEQDWKFRFRSYPRYLNRFFVVSVGGGDHTGLTTFLCLSWSDLIVFCFHRTSREEWRQQWNEAWCCCKYTELIGRNSWFSFLSGLWRLICAHIWLHYLFPHE